MVCFNELILGLAIMPYQSVKGGFAMRSSSSDERYSFWDTDQILVTAASFFFDFVKHINNFLKFLKQNIAHQNNISLNG